MRYGCCVQEHTSCKTLVRRDTQSPFMHGHWHCIFKEVGNFPLSQFLLKTQSFGSCHCFLHQVNAWNILLLQLDRAYWLSLDLSLANTSMSKLSEAHLDKNNRVVWDYLFEPRSVDWRIQKGKPRGGHSSMEERRTCLHLPTKSTGNEIADAPSKGADQL